MPLPRTSPMIIRTPYGVSERLVQVAADVGRGAWPRCTGRRPPACPTCGPSGRSTRLLGHRGEPGQLGDPLRLPLPDRATAAAMPVASTTPADVDRGRDADGSALGARRRPRRARWRAPPTASTARQDANAAARNGAAAISADVVGAGAVGELDGRRRARAARRPRRRRRGIRGSAGGGPARVASSVRAPACPIRARLMNGLDHSTYADLTIRPSPRTSGQTGRGPVPVAVLTADRPDGRGNRSDRFAHPGR